MSRNPLLPVHWSFPVNTAIAQEAVKELNADMPDIPSLLRRFWPWPPDHLGESLDQASQQLGEHLSTASQAMGCTLDDAAHSLGWGEACTKPDNPDWPETTAGDTGWNDKGWSGLAQAAGGGGGGGFGGGSSGTPSYEIPVNRAVQFGAALVVTGLLITGVTTAIQSGSTLVEETVQSAVSPAEAAPASINGIAPERLAQARVVNGPGQNGGNANFGEGGTNPVAMPQPPFTNPCADRDSWYALPPTPTPTPLPHPLGCQIGQVLREPPRVLAFIWQPEHPTLGSQQPVWRSPGEGLVEFAITAQGGRFYAGESSGNGCHLTERDDPLVRIEMDWVLLPPSVHWIEGPLSQRYYDAYSRAEERGIQCVTVWEGRSQRVETSYPDWQPLDPGIYGVRIHLYTAGDGAHPEGYGLKSTPVPVYLRDSTLEK